VSGIPVWPSRDPIEEEGGINLYQYSLGDPILNSDLLGLGTFQIGLSVNWTLGAFTGNLSGGIAIDGHGNVAAYDRAGGGLGIGAKLSGGGRVTLGGSNGDSVNDLAGPFTTGSIGGGAGLVGSVDTFEGPGSHGQPVAGGGITFGVGEGASASGGGSGTGIHPIWTPTPPVTPPCGQTLA
jgi:hypothetical protein